VQIDPGTDAHLAGVYPGLDQRLRPSPVATFPAMIRTLRKVVRIA